MGGSGDGGGINCANSGGDGGGNGVGGGGGGGGLCGGGCVGGGGDTGVEKTLVALSPTGSLE